jgi:inosine-uridine nucleoside N-ribohydrolase
MDRIGILLIAAIGVAFMIQPFASGQTEKPAAKQPRRAVILTTDCGCEMDDQWALAHLALSTEQIDLLGIVTTHTGKHGKHNIPASEYSARVAREVLEQLPLPVRPPVLAGSSVPLRQKAEAQKNPGVEFILKESRGYHRDRRLTVLVIGAATDVALALNTDPTLSDRIELVTMAFNEWPKGDDLFNVLNDIKAWQVLLESSAPIVVGDAAVCMKHLRLTRERAKELFGGRGAPGRYLTSLLVTWLDRQGDLAEKMGDRHSWPVWDEVAVAYLLGFTKREIHSRPRMRDDMTFEHPAAAKRPESTITWVTEINAVELWTDFVHKLDRARSRAGQPR